MLLQDAMSSISRKHVSPLVIRKYVTKIGTFYVALITDHDLTDLDNTVLSFLEKYDAPRNVEEARRVVAELSDHLVNTYRNSEGIAVVTYFDKLLISSLYGDFMNHAMCRNELYMLLNFMTNV